MPTAFDAIRWRSRGLWRSRNGATLLFLFIVSVCCAHAQQADVDVLTNHNDNRRTGAYLSETQLNIQNVQQNFGKLFTLTVDGCIYGQPLYMAGVDLPGMGKRNVLFIVTEHNSVYAFDADYVSPQSAKPLWQHSFINPHAGVSCIPSRAYDVRLPLDILVEHLRYQDIMPEIGITSTPVIDRASNTLYLVASTLEPNGVVHRLHAVDIATGNVVGSREICGDVAGQGDGSSGGRLRFLPRQHLQRPALLLAKGVVYVTFASHGDLPNGDLTDISSLLANIARGYQGWVFAYVARSLRPCGAYCTTPNSTNGIGTLLAKNPVGSGIWMSGAGPSADTEGNVYVVTANGASNPENPHHTEYGNSILKLHLEGDRGFAVSDFFTPKDSRKLSEQDLDLGSCGVLLLPDGLGGPQHPNLLVTGSKQGNIFVADTNSLGGYDAAADRILQTIPLTAPPSGMALSPTPPVRVQEPQLPSRENRQHSHPSSAHPSRGQHRLAPVVDPFIPGHIHSAPIFWGAMANPLVYLWPENSSLLAYPLSEGKLDANRVKRGPVILQEGMPGAMLSLSANGSDLHSAIVWAAYPSQGTAFQNIVSGTLAAFDASNINRPALWHSNLAGADEIGNFAKFCPPTIAQGKVYMASFSCQVSIYGHYTRRETAPLLADTYVEAGNASSQNFGAIRALALQRQTDDSHSDQNRCVYLKFQAPAFTEAPHSAMLTLTLKTRSMPNIQARNVRVYGMVASWEENTITWDNAPGLDRDHFAAIDSEFVAKHRILLSPSAVTFDVTSFVQKHPGELLTFQLMEDRLDNSVLGDRTGRQKLEFLSKEEAKENQIKLQSLTFRANSSGQTKGPADLTLIWK